MPTVAEVVAQTLKEYETEKFFCFMGGDHELWYALEDVGIEIINGRSEGGAVYMADGYGRVSGKPGFVYGQRGPGVANVAGAMADPVWASSPLVSFTSSIGMHSRDRFEYQELNGIDLHKGVTTWNKEVSVPERAAAMLRAAIRVATGPAPRPVHLEIEAGMYGMDAGKEVPYREENHGEVNSRRVPPPRGVMEQIVDRLLKAKKPIILAGKGVVISDAWDALTKFADALSIPVVTSLGGKGAISEDHDLAVGTCGRNSRKVANDTIRASDAILVIGSRMGGLVTHRWALPFQEKTLFQIDSNSDMLGHNYQTDISVLADARAALEDGMDIIRRKKLKRARTAWAKSITKNVEAWRKNAADMAKEQPEDGIHPAAIVAAMRAVMKPQDLVGADTGAIGSWGGTLFPVKAGKTFVRANGSLGWVVPGVMGAAVGRPQHKSVALSGDGGVLYNISEIETALRCNIPTMTVVLNNACLASEYHTQLGRRQGRVVSSVLDFRDTDFGAVASSFGAYGARVTHISELKDALNEAYKQDIASLVDVVTSKDTVGPSANRDASRKV
jgi:acetolactate synthase-1/2/3 large subunit